jgi:hypothetical protein
MPVILATQKAEIRKITIQGQPRQKVRTYLKNTPHTKKGLAGWLGGWEGRTVPMLNTYRL